MADFQNLNGLDRIVSGQIAIPYWGTWVADIVIATADTITTYDTLNLGNLSLQGFAYYVSNFAGSRSVRLVGGVGGWEKTVAAQAYRAAGGVLMSTVLKDAAAAVGETVSIYQDANLGPAFMRERAPAQRLLRQLSGALWWMDPTGITQIGTPRNTATIQSPFSVISYSGGKGQYIIATENYADWQPGRTFVSPVISVPTTIAAVVHVIENSGKVRTEVLGT